MPLQISFGWLRSLFVLPVIIFLALLLGSIIGSFGIAYSSLTSHLATGGLLYFEDQYVELEFPRNWLGSYYEYSNSTYGNGFTAIFVAPNVFVLIGLTIYDKTATQSYIKTYNLKDAHSVVIFQLNETYTSILQTSDSNATIASIENSTISICNHTVTADYSTCLFEKAYVNNNGTQSNITYMNICYFDNQRLIQIAYWGDQNAFSNSYPIFTTFLNDLKVKT
jgi:hypothetical protein